MSLKVDFQLLDTYSYIDIISKSGNMFRNLRVDGNIKIFSYDNRILLFSVNDINSKRELKFADNAYLNFVHNNISLVNPFLFDITMHEINVLLDRQTISQQYINKTLSQEIVERQITYDPITESIFANIHCDYNNLHE